MAAVCQVEGCLRPASAKGWCQRHYYALRPMPLCSIAECDRAAYKRGWCNMHYQRWRTHGDPRADHRRTRSWCSVDGCERGVHGDGLCGTHLARWRRTGTTEPRKREPESDHTRCARCGKAKHKSQFSPAPGNTHGVGTYCKACAAARRREQRVAEPDAMRQRERRYSLKKRGLTVAQYDSLLTAQGGVCAICKGPANGKGGTYHVDHDHSCCPGSRSCGACVRGVICHSCNVLLGHANDDPVRLRAAIRYLTNPPARRSLKLMKELT